VSIDALIGPLALLMTSQREAIGELFEARRVLEPAIAALAASRATPDEVQEMERILEDQAREIAEGAPGSRRTPRFTPRSARPLQPDDHAARARDHGSPHAKPRESINTRPTDSLASRPPAHRPGDRASQ
jgi:DNA-binding FadR family transcriptional regulator